MLLFSKQDVYESLHNSRRTSIIERILKDVPEVKPLSLVTGGIIFGGLALVGIGIGATIATYVFFGTATLVGFIALAESNKYIKYLIVKSNKTIDLLIFGATLYATVTLGVTITAALTFAGIGYTLVYAPYVRNQLLLNN